MSKHHKKVKLKSLKDAKLDEGMYSCVAQFLMHAENTSWNRFYNFLMVNSILVLAWATLYNPLDLTPQRDVVLTAICILGGVSCVFWAGLGYRGRQFVNLFVEIGQLEPATPKPPATLDSWPGLFKLIDYKIHSYSHSWAGSYYILTFGPLVFMVLYAVLLWTVFPEFGFAWGVGDIVVIISIILCVTWRKRRRRRESKIIPPAQKQGSEKKPKTIDKT